MKFFILTFFIGVSIVGIGQDLDPLLVREMYFEGWQGTCGATELSDLLSEHEVNEDPLLLAYKGAALATLAKCKKTPFSKMSVFKDGKSLLNEAVAKAPESLEIRFLRYTIQTNIPNFLNYNNQEEDKKLILEILTLHKDAPNDDDLNQRIIQYLNDAGALSEKEQKQVKMLTAGG